MAAGFNLTAQLNLKGPTNVSVIVADIKKQLGSINASVNLTVAPAATTNINKLNAALLTFNKTLSSTSSSANNTAAAIRNLGTAIGSINAASLPQTLNSAASATNKLAQASANSARQLAATTTEMTEFGKQSGLAIRRFAAFSTVTGVVYGLSNAINNGIRAYIDYDKELVKLQQVTGQSAAGLKGLENTITSLATNLGVGSAELTKISSTLAQAGLSARDTEKALKALALSSLAPSFDSMNETVEGSIALMRQFGINAGDLEKALGSVNSVAAKFAVEAADLITAIQRTGGVFATASKGVSEGTDALNEFLAVFTSIRATTRESAETIATGLRTIFTRIQRGDTIQALKEYGVNLQDLDGKFVGAYKAVELLSKGLGSLDPRDLRFSKIVEELGGFRQIGKVIPLIQQFATAQDALKVAQTGQGSLAADAAKAQEALAVQISKVREEFLALFREIGQSDSFQAIAKGALSVTSALIKAADSIKGVLPVLGVMLAFKGASAAVQFGSGFLSGVRGSGGARGLGNRMGGGPGMNSGGEVMRFAAGGYVPGFGNGDSISAKLTPGEFVMSKPAVQSIGVGNLHSLNRSRGGLIQHFDIGGMAEINQKGTANRGVKKSKSSRAAWNPEPIEPPNPPKTLPLGRKTNFTHLHTSIEQSRIPESIRKAADKEGVDLTRLYSNMGLDLPENWNKNWNLKKQDRWGASTESLRDYISRKGAKVFTTLLKTGKNVGNYRFHGRGQSKAFEILKLDGENIASSLASKLAINRFFDTDPEVESVLPTLLKNSVYEVLAKKSGQAKILMKGFEEVSAYKAQGVKGRKAVGESLRPSIAGSKLVANILGKSSPGYKRSSTGGGIYKFADAGLVSATVAKRASTSEIIKLLGLETAAKAGGISATDVYTILNKRTPNAEQAASKAAILAEFTKKQNRLSGAKEARTTRITSKGLLFGAAGMLGSAFSPINKKIVSDQLKAPVDVRIVSGIMDPAVASSVEESFTSSINKASGKAAKKVMISDILAKTGLGKELNLDFDRTLAFGADKILSDPKTPKFAEFGDRNKVSAALKGAKLSLLGKELAGLVSSKPELLGNLKLITARPASTLDLVQGWLASKGLPIPLSQFKGLGGPGVSGSQIAKLKAALLNPGSLFVDDDSRNIKAAKARSKEGIQAYRYGNRKISSNPNAEATAQGILFEKMIQKLGGPGALKGQGMDFPQGLKGAAKYFGIPANIATDAKRTISGPSTVEDNIITYLKTQGYNLGGLIQKFPIGGKVFRGVDIDKGFMENPAPSPFATPKVPMSDFYSLEKMSGLKKWQFDRAVEFAKNAGYSLPEFKNYLKQLAEENKRKLGLKTDTDALRKSLIIGTPIATEDQIALAGRLNGPADSKYRPILTESERIAVDRARIRSSALKDIRKATGLAGGGQPEDTVPALVSNGEAYVPPEIAKSIGYGKLREMNMADRNGMNKFASGGISIFRGPGSGTSDSIGPIALPVGSFILREKATKALGLNSGGSVQRFVTGGLPLRPDSIQSSTVSINDNAVNALKNLQKVIEGLGLTSTKIASLLVNASAVSYKAAEKVAQAELDRVKSASGSIDQIIASENALAAIRDAKNKDVGKRNTLESAFGSVAGKSSGQVQQQIMDKANMEADRKIKAKEASLAANKPAREAARVEQEKELIVRKKEEDFKKIEKDLIAKASAKATPLTPVNLPQIQQEASKQVLSKSSTGEYDLTPEEKETIRKRTVGNDTLTDEQKKSIYEKSTIRATTKFTGKSRQELEASGIGANDIRAYVQQSQMDRKTLAQMDKELLRSRREEFKTYGTIRGMTVKSASEAETLMQQELATRRKMATTMAQAQGLYGPGMAGYTGSGWTGTLMGSLGASFGGLGNKAAASVRQTASGIYNRGFGGNLMALGGGIRNIGAGVGGQAGFMASMGLGLVAGQGEHIAGAFTNDKKSKAGLGSGIEAGVGTAAAGLGLASSVAMIPGLGPFAAAAILAGTAVTSFTEGIKAADKGVRDFEQNLRTKAIEDAGEKLAKAAEQLQKDPSDGNARTKVISAVKESSALIGTDNEKRLKDAQAAKASTQGIFSYIMGGKAPTLDASEINDIAKQRAKNAEQPAQVARMAIESRMESGEKFSTISGSSEFKELAGIIAETSPEFQAAKVRIEAMSNATVAATGMTRDQLIAQQKEVEVTKLQSDAGFLAKSKTTEAARAMDEANKAGRQLAMTFASMAKSFEQALGKVSYELDLMDDATDSAIDALSGQAKISKTRSKDVDVLKNPDAYDEKTKQETSKRMADFIVRPNEAGLDPLEQERRQQEAGSIEKLLNSDPDKVARRATGAVANVVRKNAGANLDTAAGQARTQLESDTKDLPEQVKAEIFKKFEAIKKAVDATTGLDAKGKTDLLAQKLQDELGDAASDTAKKVKEMAISAASFKAERINKFIDAVNRAGAAQLKATEFLNKAKDIRTESDISLREVTSGGKIGLAERQQIVNDRVGRLTGGEIDPTKISQNIEKQTAQRTALQNTVNDESKDEKDRMKAAESLKNLDVEINKNQQALEELANSTDMASAAMDQLQNVQKMQADRLANIDQILTSTPQELKKLNESLIRVQQRAMGINPGPSRDAQKAYNMTLRQTGGNRRLAMEAGQAQMAQDRAIDLRTMEQYKTTYKLSLQNQVNPQTGKKYSDEESEKKFQTEAANVRGQMAFESGAIRIPGLAQGIMSSVIPNIDSARKDAEQAYNNANANQAIAQEQLGRLELVKADRSLLDATTALEKAFKDLPNSFNQIQKNKLEDVHINVGKKEFEGDIPPAGDMPIFASSGKYINFVAKGTDTVPAMLTPGEFVVNAKATAQHLPLLHAINSGTNLVGNTAMMSRGGVVYLAAGGVTRDEKEPEDIAAETANEFSAEAAADRADPNGRYGVKAIESMMGKNPEMGYGEMVDSVFGTPGQGMRQGEPVAPTQAPAQASAVTAAATQQATALPSYAQTDQRSQIMDGLQPQVSGGGQPAPIPPQTAAKINAGTAAASMPVVDASGSNAAPMPIRTVDPSGTTAPMPMRDLSIAPQPLSKDVTKQVNDALSAQTKTVEQITGGRSLAIQSGTFDPGKGTAQERKFAAANGMTVEEVKFARQQQNLARMAPEKRQKEVDKLLKDGKLLSPSQLQAESLKLSAMQQAASETARVNSFETDLASRGEVGKKEFDDSKGKMPIRSSSELAGVVTDISKQDAQTFFDRTAIAVSTPASSMKKSEDGSGSSQQSSADRNRMRALSGMSPEDRKTIGVGVLKESKEEEYQRLRGNFLADPANAKAAEGFAKNEERNAKAAASRDRRDKGLLESFTGQRDAQRAANAQRPENSKEREMRWEDFADSKKLTGKERDRFEQSVRAADVAKSQAEVDAHVKDQAEKSQREFETAYRSTDEYKASAAATAKATAAAEQSKIAADKAQANYDALVAKQEADNRTRVQAKEQEQRDAETKQRSQDDQALALASGISPADYKPDGGDKTLREKIREDWETIADNKKLTGPEKDAYVNEKAAKEEAKRIREADKIVDDMRSGKREASEASQIARLRDMGVRSESMPVTPSLGAVASGSIPTPDEAKAMAQERAANDPRFAAVDANREAKKQAKVEAANMQALQESQNAAAAQQAAIVEAEKQRQDSMWVNSQQTGFTGGAIRTLGAIGGVTSAVGNAAVGAATVAGGAIGAVASPITGGIGYALSGSASGGPSGKYNSEGKLIGQQPIPRTFGGNRGAEDGFGAAVGASAMTNLRAVGEGLYDVAALGSAAGEAVGLGYVTREVSKELGFKGDPGIFGYQDTTAVTRGNIRRTNEVREGMGEGAAFVTEFAQTTANLTAQAAVAAGGAEGHLLSGAGKLVSAVPGGARVVGAIEKGAEVSGKVGGAVGSKISAGVKAIPGARQFGSAVGGAVDDFVGGASIVGSEMMGTINASAGAIRRTGSKIGKSAKDTMENVTESIKYKIGEPARNARIAKERAAKVAEEMKAEKLKNGTQAFRLGLSTEDVLRGARFNIDNYGTDLSRSATQNFIKDSRRSAMLTPDASGVSIRDKLRSNIRNNTDEANEAYRLGGTGQDPKLARETIRQAGKPGRSQAVSVAKRRADEIVREKLTAKFKSQISNKYKEKFAAAKTDAEKLQIQELANMELADAMSSSNVGARYSRNVNMPNGAKPIQAAPVMPAAPAVVPKPVAQPAPVMPAAPAVVPKPVAQPAPVMPANTSSVTKAATSTTESFIPVSGDELKKITNGKRMYGVDGDIFSQNGKLFTRDPKTQRMIRIVERENGFERFGVGLEAAPTMPVKPASPVIPVKPPTPTQKVLNATDDSPKTASQITAEVKANTAAPTKQASSPGLNEARANGSTPAKPSVTQAAPVKPASPAAAQPKPVAVAAKPKPAASSQVAPVKPATPVAAPKPVAAPTKPATPVAAPKPVAAPTKPATPVAAPKPVAATAKPKPAASSQAASVSKQEEFNSLLKLKKERDILKHKRDTLDPRQFSDDIAYEDEMSNLFNQTQEASKKFDEARFASSFHQDPGSAVRNSKPISFKEAEKIESSGIFGYQYSENMLHGGQSSMRKLRKAREIKEEIGDTHRAIDSLLHGTLRRKDKLVNPDDMFDPSNYERAGSIKHMQDQYSGMGRFINGKRIKEAQSELAEKVAKSKELKAELKKLTTSYYQKGGLVYYASGGEIGKEKKQEIPSEIWARGVHYTNVMSSEDFEKRNVIRPKLSDDNMYNTPKAFEDYQEAHRKPISIDPALLDKQSSFSKYIESGGRRMSENVEIRPKPTTDEVLKWFSDSEKKVNPLPRGNRREYSTGGLVYASKGSLITQISPPGKDIVDISNIENNERVFSSYSDRINSSTSPISDSAIVSDKVRVPQPKVSSNSTRINGTIKNISAKMAQGKEVQDIKGIELSENQVAKINNLYTEAKDQTVPALDKILDKQSISKASDNISSITNNISNVIKSINQQTELVGSIGTSGNKELFAQMSPKTISSSVNDGPQYKAGGGIVYASNGTLIAARSVGTDTVPAMLTPGEFVVNRQATQQHMPILQAINSGAYNQGGVVKYLAEGGMIAPTVMAPRYLSSGGGVTPQYLAAGGSVGSMNTKLDAKDLDQAIASFGEKIAKMQGVVDQMGSHVEEMGNKQVSMDFRGILQHTGLGNIKTDILNQANENAALISQQVTSTSWHRANTNSESQLLGGNPDGPMGHVGGGPTV